MAWSPAIKRRSWTGGCAATTGSPTREPPNSRPRWVVCAPTPPSLLAVWAWPEGLHEGTGTVPGRSARESRRRRRMSVTATGDSRIEKRYRRLLVAALTEFRIPQAVASSITGHPHWGLTATLGLADLPMAAGAPGVILLVFLRLRRLAGLGALATAIGQVAAGAVPAFAGYADPAVAFTVLLSCTAAAALLLSPGPDRGLALLTRSGTALVGAGALILGGFSVGGDVWFGPGGGGAPPRFGGFGGKVVGLPADLLIAAVLVG